MGGGLEVPPGHWREAPGLERLLEVRVVLHLVDDALRLLEEVLQLPVRRLTIHRGQHLGGRGGGAATGTGAVESPPSQIMHPPSILLGQNIGTPKRGVLC